MHPRRPLGVTVLSGITHQIVDEARLQRTIMALQQADKQMMDWMRNFQEPDSTRLPRAQVDVFWRQELPGL
jgi:hypothetical protein